jgi:ATP-dependent exoDNAse (exonuclease V) beta subunit
VAAFKGLESDAVLLLDAQLGREDRLASLYVAMTRARAVLAVLRSRRLDATWASLQQDFGRRLAGASS